MYLPCSEFWTRNNSLLTLVIHRNDDCQVGKEKLWIPMVLFSVSCVNDTQSNEYMTFDRLCCLLYCWREKQGIEKSAWNFYIKRVIKLSTNERRFYDPSEINIILIKTLAEKKRSDGWGINKNILFLVAVSSESCERAVFMGNRELMRV